MSMEQWWNGTDRGKPKYWEKNRYTVWVVDGWMCVEQRWNGTDRVKLKCWEKNIIKRGWKKDETVWSNGGIVLTGEN